MTTMSGLTDLEGNPLPEGYCPVHPASPDGMDAPCAVCMSEFGRPWWHLW